MELILRPFYEGKKSRAEWRQIVGAVILALSTGWMYHYVSVQAEYIAENKGESLAPAAFYAGLGSDVKIRKEREFFKRILMPDSISENFKTPVLELVEDTETDTEMFIENRAEDAGRAEKGKDTRSKKATAVKKDKARKQAVLPENQMPDAINPEKRGGITEIPDGSGASEKDTVKAEEIIKIPEPVVEKEISGFVCNAQGHIVGVAQPSKFMKDSLVVLPRNSACTGIKRYSFKGLEEKISEIYIPANIVYIEQGVFDDLPNLIYIEAQQGNAGYYSVNGILYYRDGKVAACPNRQRNR
ncbi:MAG: hypothetical protein HFG98_06015 [Dorea sp.]|nr:hypothetical protein [Dorea sp.]